MNTVSQAPASTDAGWHAQFSPSAADRWIPCPGSIAASRGVEKTSNKFADEGTAAHTLASRCFDYGKPAAFWIGETIEVGGVQWPVTEDMADYVQQYVDDVNSRVCGGTRLHEQRVYFSESIGVPDQGGTSDAIILSADCKRLIVEDLKFGLGVQVDAEENAQMMTYAIGVLETFSVVMDMDSVEEVTLVIHQPRLDHVSEWTCSIDRLHQHAATIREAAEIALSACSDADNGIPLSDAYFKVTEKGCRWCPVKATCDHYRRHVSALVFDDFETLDSPDVLQVMGAPQVPVGPALGQLYGVLDMIEDWCRGVRGEVERLVLAGMDVIGPDGARMKLVEGKKGRRYWTDKEQAKAFLLGILSREEYIIEEVITPAVAEKKVKKKASKAQWADIQAAVVKQAPGKAHVVLGSDPRPPYSPEAGASEFEDLE